MMYHDGYNWLAMILMMAFSLLFLIAVVAVVVWLVGRPRAIGTETPLDILKKRYVKGEISKEEYERMKQDLS